MKEEKKGLKEADHSMIMGEEVNSTAETAVAEAGEAAAERPHFVLVHGIGGGGWCWYKIRCLMENSGYRVSCIDLKSAGIDQSDVDTVLCFDDYNKPLEEFLSALPENEKVILVGHSAGGLNITQATHKFPQKIAVSVYVAATMLKFGVCNEQDVKDGSPDLSEFGDVYELGFALGVDHPPTSAIIKKEFLRKIVYHMSPKEDVTLAAMLLRPGPLLALLTARFTEDNDGIDEVPRVYIKTLNDRVMKPDQQDTMIRRWPPSAVYELESDHSPFFSTPFQLFGLLVKALASVGGN